MDYSQLLACIQVTAGEIKLNYDRDTPDSLVAYIAKIWPESGLVDQFHFHHAWPSLMFEQIYFTIMPLLTSPHAAETSESRQIEQDGTQAGRQSQPTNTFDARDRLRGTLDDTTVRQAVIGLDSVSGWEKLNR